MTSFRRWVALAWLTALPGVASAQVAADSTVTTDRPFVPGGVYDKPYLTSLAGRTAIGGYAEAHTRWEQADGVRDGFGFELKR